MAYPEGVIRAFLPFREAGDPVLLAQGGHAFAAAGEDLMGVALMAHVPHQAVFRSVEDIVQGDGQFHCAEVGRQMATGAANRFQQELPHLRCQVQELALGKQPQLVGGGDGVQQWKVAASGHNPARG